MFRATLRALTLSSLLLCLHLAAYANTIHVPADQPTIASALAAAVDGDTIVLADGTYNEHDLVNGSPNGGIGFTLKSESGNPAACIIDCQQQGRALLLSRATPVVLSGLTITNGFSGGGGAILSAPPLTLTNCIFTNNNSGGPLADGFGGAIYSVGVLTATNCTFTNNVAGTNFNFANSGGAILSFGVLTVTNCTFTNNIAVTGAAIDAEGNFAGVPVATITNCTFTNNVSKDGAVTIELASAQIMNCTFAGNLALLDNLDAGFSGSAITNNSGDPGLVVNCIFWGNTAPAVYDFEALTLTANLIQGGVPNDLNTFNEPIDGGGNLDVDPLFVRNPGTNGPDDLGDLHLQFGSPAIDSGLDSAVTVPPFPADSAGQPLDLDGNLRISRAHVDMGAYEYQNQAPIANPQSLSLNQDTSLGITLTGSDPENDALTFAVVTGPAHGLLSGTAPNLTYTPNPGYVGADRFTFQVQDVFGALSNIAAVSLTVKDTTPPVITLNGSNPMTVNQGGMFTDPGATALDNVDGPVPVSVSGSVNTAVVGTYTLTYSASDKAGNTAVKTRTVHVVAAPIIEVKLTSLGELFQFVGVIVTIQNSGGAPASNLRITSANLIGVNALLIAPNTWFNLGVGKSAQVGLLFYPLQKGRQGTLSISGSYSGGTFSFSQNVVIP